MDPITTDLAQATVVMLVVGGTGYLAGYLSGRRERQQTQRQRVASRRARRIEDRHRAPESEETQGPDTVADEPVEQTARQRFTGIAMAPAAGMRGEARILRQATMEVRVISEELLAGAGMREVFAAVYGEEPERLPLYEEVVSEYPTGCYSIVTQPDQPPKPDDNQKPKLRRRKKHAHGGAR